MTKRKAKPVEPGSRHLDPRRTFRCSKEEFAAQDKAARRWGKPWTQWVREELTLALLKEKP